MTTSELPTIRAEVDRLRQLGKDLVEDWVTSYRARLADDEADRSKADTKVEQSDDEVELLHPIAIGRRYQKWYTPAEELIRIALPSRYDEFCEYYRRPNRKERNRESYCLSDFFRGVGLSNWKRIRLEGVALELFLVQLDIMSSLDSKLEFVVSDLNALVQANILDSEIDAAEELLRSGYLRASGTMAGVVVERHLASCATNAGLKTRKKRPTISTWNDLLKDDGRISTASWRRIQVLGDLRNHCAHPSTDEPAQQDVEDLIVGARRLLRELT